MKTATEVIFQGRNQERIDNLVDRALDLLFPIFQEKGWTWAGVRLSREMMDSELWRMIEGCAKRLDSSDSKMVWQSFGRLIVKMYKDGDDADLYDITIGLSAGFECVSDEELNVEY